MNHILDSLRFSLNRKTSCDFSISNISHSQYCKSNTDTCFCPVLSLPQSPLVCKPMAERHWYNMSRWRWNRSTTRRGGQRPDWSSSSQPDNRTWVLGSQPNNRTWVLRFQQKSLKVHHDYGTHTLIQTYVYAVIATYYKKQTNASLMISIRI